MIKKTLVFSAPHPYDRILVWDVSTKPLRDRAYIDLFQLLDNELDVYKNGDSAIFALLDLARSGNPEACEALLAYRRNKEGEKFQEIEVRSPGTDVPVLLEIEERMETKVLWDEKARMGMLPPIEEIERHKKALKAANSIG